MHNRLNDEGISIVLRALRAVLKRLGVEFDPPFRDFVRFRDYWIGQRMDGSYAARRNYLNDLFDSVFSQLEQLEDQQATASVRGVDGQLKNIVFASTGPKPQIVLRDAINNVVEVVENAEYCLFYDRLLSEAGLTWAELVDWWQGSNSLEDQDDVEVARRLYRRLAASLDSPPEKSLFRIYYEHYGSADSAGQPRYCLRSTFTTTLGLAESVWEGQPSLCASVWTSFCFYPMACGSYWRWTASSTTRKVIPPRPSSTRRWCPRTGDYGYAAMRCTGSAGMSYLVRAQPACCVSSLTSY
jgi:hypothetical protein